MRQTFEGWLAADRNAAYSYEEGLTETFGRAAWDAAVSMMEAESKLQIAQAVNEEIAPLLIELSHLEDCRTVSGDRITAVLKSWRIARAAVAKGADKISTCPTGAAKDGDAT